jgi:hypothetical protein
MSEAYQGIVVVRRRNRRVPYVRHAWHALHVESTVMREAHTTGRTLSGTSSSMQAIVRRLREVNAPVISPLLCCIGDWTLNFSRIKAAASAVVAHADGSRQPKDGRRSAVR